MKHWKKFLAAIVMVLLAAAVICLCSTPQRRITRFVENNQEALEALAESCLRGAPAAASFQKAQVEQVFPGKQDIVQFSYGHSGFRYYGFYYAPQDQPAAYQNADCPLTPAGKHTWEWSDGTDNGGRTVKIMEKWYFYEAWF